MTTSGTPLDKESYINIESFRKNGTGVKTPVWAAPLDGKLVVFCESKSYKVKRVRNNPAVKVAACSVSGTVRGPWYDGTCRVLEPADYQRAHAAIKKKYGWQIAIGDFFARLSGRIDKRAYLEITIPA